MLSPSAIRIFYIKKQKRMKRLSSRLHGVLDYAAIVFLLLSPSLFHLESSAATFAFALAMVHLILTLFTDFELGFVKVIPLKVHGLIELFVSIALVLIANAFRVSGDLTAFYFYLTFSIALFFVWMISSYRVAASKY